MLCPEAKGRLNEPGEFQRGPESSLKGFRRDNSGNMTDMIHFKKLINLQT